MSSPVLLSKIAAARKSSPQSRLSLFSSAFGLYKSDAAPNRTYLILLVAVVELGSPGHRERKP
jgi:hypothetical protein